MSPGRLRSIIPPFSPGSPELGRPLEGLEQIETVAYRGTPTEAQLQVQEELGGTEVGRALLGVTAAAVERLDDAPRGTQRRKRMPEESEVALSLSEQAELGVTADPKDSNFRRLEEQERLLAEFKVEVAPLGLRYKERMLQDLDLSDRDAYAGLLFTLIEKAPRFSHVLNVVRMLGRVFGHEEQKVRVRIDERSLDERTRDAVLTVEGVAGELEEES